MSFKKDDYIVALKINNLHNYTSIKENYIIKQRCDSSYLQTNCDITGHANSNSYFTFDKAEDLKDWRHATSEEIAEYERLGKPFDVTTLKPKFIVGKWYKNLCRDKNYYGKFKELRGNDFWVSEFIDNNKRYINDTGTAEYDYAEECHLEEIQQYLPGGHPDKRPKSLMNRYLKALKDRAQCISSIKKGDYVHITGISDVTVLTKNNDTYGFSANDISPNGNCCWELMPEGFVPPSTQEPTYHPIAYSSKETLDHYYKTFPVLESLKDELKQFSKPTTKLLLSEEITLLSTKVKSIKSIQTNLLT